MKRRGLRVLGIVVAIAVAPTAACGREAGRTGDGTVDVVTAFFPLAHAAERIGGNAVDVENLTPPGVEPHDVELTADAVDRIEDADLVVYVGGGFQPALERAARRTDAHVDVLDALAIESDDPHFWLDPGLMAEAASAIEDALADVVPRAERDGVHARAQVFRDQLAALDQRLRAGLKTCARRDLVTAHDAFGYLARRYQLTTHAIAGLSPDVEPDPARLSELADLVKRTGTTTIFTEELVSPRVAETLARETGATTAVLNPLEGAADANASYVSMMNANLAALVTALGCT